MLADGRELLQSCTVAQSALYGRGGNTAEESFQVGTCLGTIAGVMGTLGALEGSQDGIVVACNPPEASVGDVLPNVLNYLRSHPGELTHGEGPLIIRAMKQSYPCK